MCRYTGGCRCDKCRETHRLRIQRYVAERKQREPGYFAGKNVHTITCPRCNQTAEVDSRSTHCSRSCAVAAGNDATPRGIALRTAEPPPLKPCKWCLALHVGTAQYCSDECRTMGVEAYAQSLRCPLRVALKNGDLTSVVVELRKQSLVNDEGCWLWPKVDNDGYPCRTTRDRSLHRQVLEAKHGQPLGSQAAHHVCANRACVNPDHLQPVTHRDNIAEMLARRSYVARIQELKQALAECAPDHPLLTHISVA